MASRSLRVELPAAMVEQPVLRQMAGETGVLVSIREVHLGEATADTLIELEGDESGFEACQGYLTARGIPWQEA